MDPGLDESTDVMPRRGRPRSPAADEAILRAAIDLLTEGGLAAATIDAISERSGSAKTTIYRRWPTRDGLLLDAMRVAVDATEPARAGNAVAPNGDSVITDAAVRIFGLSQSPVFRGAFPVIARELLTAGSALGQRFRDEIFLPMRTALRQRISEEMAAGIVRSDVDQDLVLDLVHGAVLYRALLDEPLNETVVRQIAAMVREAAAARRPELR
jgi:AcrR family transcriptional regulator